MEKKKLDMQSKRLCGLIKRLCNLYFRPITALQMLPIADDHLIYQRWILAAKCIYTHIDIYTEWPYKCIYCMLTLHI